MLLLQFDTAPETRVMRPAMTRRGLQRLLLIPDNKVAADFRQIIEGAKSLQIHMNYGKPCQLSAHH